MASGELRITTSTHMELVDITTIVNKAVKETGILAGLCTVYNPHTTAGVTINEGADPDVKTDIIDALRTIVPLDYPFRHGEGNSPSHVMATLTGSSTSLIVRENRLVLGTWQRIFFCEFDGPRQRKLLWHVLPD